jgi:hypothetical protein
MLPNFDTHVQNLYKNRSGQSLLCLVLCKVRLAFESIMHFVLYPPFDHIILKALNAMPLPKISNAYTPNSSKHTGY